MESIKENIEKINLNNTPQEKRWKTLHEQILHILMNQFPKKDTKKGKEQRNYYPYRTQSKKMQTISSSDL